ncbi:hypothetical protein DMA15_24130 [Streptomyces sp. WAC 01529]|uniref:hypothetical protein n=1 Tax=Streptomyces sp. WAC 01529 TaxID=2203205 RepID=UPI000F6F8B8D|nr:hypothetical protein [Streptomyces sp. WAC 01529]AZM55272.1 hypothetical protein DMA15_24130 [Streptomyces sp. WAC 01529]
MSRDLALTERYLEKVGRPLRPAHESEFARVCYGGKYAPRPVFLGAAEIQRLTRDLEVLRGALYRLPGLLFGGDIGAFARANGMDEGQVRAVERCSAAMPDALTSMGRADLYHDRFDFRLMEFNIGSTIGYENGDMCREMLADPEFGPFAAEENLRYVDTVVEQVRTFRHEMGLAPDDRPVVALTEWPANLTELAPYMNALVKLWSDHGLDAHPCHVGQLERRDGRLWLGDRPVDIVYRQFMMQDLLDDNVDALLEPLLGALEDGEVRMFTSLESELYGSKASLAMLSDRAHRKLFSDEELAVIDRLIPWTSPVTSEPVVLEDGTEGSLLDHAVAHQQELILKPTLLYGGQGIVPGWSPEVTPEDWRRILVDAMDGPYVVQKRIHAVPEPFPQPDGETRPWIVNWGVVLMTSGYGGLLTRCAPADGDIDVLNRDLGALLGSGFHVGPSTE